MEQPINAPVHTVWCTCPLCSDWVKRQSKCSIEPIPLARAVFCASCSCITETNGTNACEYCKASTIVWLQHLLDGPNVVAASSPVSLSHSASA